MTPPVAYIVIHGSNGRAFEQPADTLGVATRIALTFVHERRSDVRVRLPDGRELPFDDFQAAVFAGKLKG